MNEEYVVGLIRVSLAEVLKLQKTALGDAFRFRDMDSTVQLIKDIQATEEELRAPDMELVKSVVKALRK